jgi:hypothetical protein
MTAGERSDASLNGDARFGGMAHLAEHRTTRQNDAPRRHGNRAERHLGVLADDKRAPCGLLGATPHRVGDARICGRCDGSKMRLPTVLLSLLLGSDGWQAVDAAAAEAATGVFEG